MKFSEKLIGCDGSLISDGDFSSIGFATDPVMNPFLTFLEKEKFLSSLENPNISCVITLPELASKIPKHIKGVFTCDQPKATLFEIHNSLISSPDYVGMAHPTVIGEQCDISPLASIDRENVILGNHVTIEPFAVIKGRVTLSDGVIVRSGAVIGCKGFSFSKNCYGENCSVYDTGRIILEENVELFEGVTISTGIFPWDNTIIGENTKIDAQCHIGHGSIIGKNCLIAAQACCCGNSRIGNNVWIGVGSIVSNRIQIGDNARVSIGAVVTKNVPMGQTVSGNFAIEHKKFISNLKKSIEE